MSKVLIEDPFSGSSSSISCGRLRVEEEEDGSTVPGVKNRFFLSLSSEE